MLQPIVLLHDAFALQGRSDASDVLVEAKHIAQALVELGFAASILSVDLDLRELERRLTALAPHVVFNLVESLDGRGQLIHVVPALLESLRLPFTGCSAAAQCSTSNKLLAKRQLSRAGLPTPTILDGNAFEASAASDARPAWIVKSVWEHASLGIDDASVLTEPTAALDTIRERAGRYGGQWFAEEYVAGRELNVAIIETDRGPSTLPVAEIRFEGFPSGKPRIVGYAAKWRSESFEYRQTVRTFAVEPELAARAQALALECWSLFELDGYARVDFRIDEQGAPWILEVNANPCLSPDAGFAAALAEAGVELKTAIAWLIGAALRRAEPGETLQRV